MSPSVITSSAFVDELQKIKEAGELHGAVRSGRRPFTVDRYLERETQTTPSQLIEESAPLAKEAAEGRTDVDRAKKWGRTGAAISAGTGLANMALHKDVIKQTARRYGKGTTAAAFGLGLAADAGLGYGVGRLAHRVAKGPATGKKVKSAGMTPTQMKALGLVAAGAGGMHVGTQAKRDWQMGRAIRKQQQGA